MPETEWTAEDMPDRCTDFCRDDPTVYIPVAWVDGWAIYACRYGHIWRCGWGHMGSGILPALHVAGGRLITAPTLGEAQR